GEERPRALVEREPAARELLDLDRVARLEGRLELLGFLVREGLRERLLAAFGDRGELLAHEARRRRVEPADGGPRRLLRVVEEEEVVRVLLEELVRGRPGFLPG